MDQNIPVKILSDVVSISGIDHATQAAITRNGDLYCWGYNRCGQIGNGTIVNQTIPVKVLNNVKSVSFSGLGSGYSTQAAITHNGDLYCWGFNGNGQIGNGTTTDQLTPVKVLDLMTGSLDFSPGDIGDISISPTSQLKSVQNLKLKYSSSSQKLKRTVGFKLTQKVTGAKTKVIFTSSNTKVAKVVKVGKTSGVISCVGVGKAVITAKAVGNSQYKAASKKATIYVIPKNAKIKSIKSKKKGQVTVKSNDTAKGNDGYQIQYKYNGKTRTVKVKGKKAISKTFKKLRSGKNFKARIRAYKKVNGKTYYGNYSKWKTLKRVC